MRDFNCEERLIRLEGRIDMLENMVVRLMGGTGREERMGQRSENVDSIRLLGNVTEKQLKSAMMIMEGRGNGEIAGHFGVSENTAKVYVRTLAKKMGVSKRGQIAMKMKDVFDSVDDKTFYEMTGVRKNWRAGRG